MRQAERTIRRLPLRHSGLALALVGLLALLLAGCGVSGPIHPTSALPPASAATTTPAPLPPVTFPQDEAPHQDLTEWWYYTGHLHGVDAQGRTHTYGFELVFFQTLRGQLPPYYAAHFAISDITAGQFHYDQRASFATTAALPAAGATTGFALALGGWTIRGLNGHGVISYGAAGFSYYYSRPLMAVTGTLSDHGAALSVTGQAWMDHQWGNFVSLAGSGWDWYSIQLANHTEYMLYVIRDAQKRPIATFGTAVAADGSASEIPPTQITSQATGSWTRPPTGGVYPSGWKLSLPAQQVSLTLTPLLRDQELVTTQST